MLSELNQVMTIRLYCEGKSDGDPNRQNVTVESDREGRKSFTNFKDKRMKFKVCMRNA